MSNGKAWRGEDERRANSIRMHLSRIGAPGMEKERKLELIRHAQHVLERDYGEVPPWIEQLRGEVEAGKL